MISAEPIISVGIIDRATEVRGELLEKFRLIDDVIVFGEFYAKAIGDQVVLYGGKDIELLRGKEVRFIPLNGGTFILKDVLFGIDFHWERKEDQTFNGTLKLAARSNGTIAVINEVTV